MDSGFRLPSDWHIAPECIVILNQAYRATAEKGWIIERWTSQWRNPWQHRCLSSTFSANPFKLWNHVETIQICENPKLDTKLVCLVSHVLCEPAPSFGGELLLINGESLLWYKSLLAVFILYVLFKFRALRHGDTTGQLKYPTLARSLQHNDKLVCHCWSRT